jgi:hypothetical protein
MTERFPDGEVTGEGAAPELCPGDIAVVVGPTARPGFLERFGVGSLVEVTTRDARREASYFVVAVDDTARRGVWVVPSVLAPMARACALGRAEVDGTPRWCSSRYVVRKRRAPLTVAPRYLAGGGCARGLDGFGACAHFRGERGYGAGLWYPSWLRRGDEKTACFGRFSPDPFVGEP